MKATATTHERATHARGALKQLQADIALRTARSPGGPAPGEPLRVLVIDVGGTSVKLLATGHTRSRSFPSGPSLAPRQMVAEVVKLVADWNYDVVSIGYPGPVLRGRPIAEPYNLGRGWVGFDFARAFGRPVKVINDAAMQALGSYHGGRMLFLGLGTGLGSAMIVDGILQPMELGHLPYKRATYEDYVGGSSLEKEGEKRWRQSVADVVKRFVAALQPDYTVIGGGNVARLPVLPTHCRRGVNSNAFRGGFRLWRPGSTVAARLPPARPRARLEA
jgi:polyphosphate glucokinase